MLEWVIGIGVFAVICIVANDWYGMRNSRPLSHMKPDPSTVKRFGWMEDLSRSNPANPSPHHPDHHEKTQEKTNDR